MSDNIPFDIQMEIIKKVYDIKSLIRFRSVSKPWKSFIDSSEFIKGYGARHTQPHSPILMYQVNYTLEDKYICLVEDDNGSFKVQQQEFAPFVMSLLPKQYYISFVVGACHGLLCFCGLCVDYSERVLVIWNPSIRKSFTVVVPTRANYGFGVCPVTSDPTIVKFVCADNMPWHVEVFTLSSGVWNVIPNGNFPRQSITLDKLTQVVIDRFIYWGAYERTRTHDGVSIINHKVVSFDLITKEFKVVNLPDTLTNEIIGRVSISKLRESLVVYGSIYVDEAKCCSVWVMDYDSSFRKLFIVGAPVDKILGFKNGETIFETSKEREPFTTLDVYDPCSQQIKNLGISGACCSFFMGSYKESLLLLDQLDSHIYYGNNFLN